jgi:putative iron-regulated protein
MKRWRASPSLAAFAVVCAVPVAACSSSSAPSAPDPVPPVIKQYALNLDASYADDVTQAKALKTAVDAFLAGPSASGLTACQQAWIAAHRSYGECEYSRFYGGPIDQTQGGINEWPIDESFIDYTVDEPTGGIINDPTDYPEITPEVLATADEKGGIENLSTGFHAIEFLLWGERPDPTKGPGTRPYTDYVDGGTASNQDRRRTYLQTVTQMLVEGLSGLQAQWDLTDSTSYGAQLLAGDPKTALADVFRGFTQMAISELTYERMDNPYVAQDQKDEESCFSETTLNDLIANAMGVEDVYTGHYQTLAGTTMQGPSMSDLVKAADPTTDSQLRQQLTVVRNAIGAIPAPFDHDVLAADGSPARTSVGMAITDLEALQPLLDKVAKDLGIINNL